jgi:rare lipoprotein A
MLNNIFKILLLGLITGCTINQGYIPHNGNYETTPSSSDNPTYSKPYPEERYRKNHPPQRLAPVAPPVRHKNPISSKRPMKRIAPSNRQPMKRIAPSNRTTPRNNLKSPSNNYSPTKRKHTTPYLKQPSSNYGPRNHNYITKGYASQYKLSEHGNRTTSGKVYDMYGMTAAHGSLPLMSNVAIKNLRTGKTIIVTINDRLHYTKNLIKLSYAAANSLNLLRYPSQLLEVRGL